MTRVVVGTTASLRPGVVSLTVSHSRRLLLNYTRSCGSCRLFCLNLVTVRGSQQAVAQLLDGRVSSRPDAPQPPGEGPSSSALPAVFTHRSADSHGSRNGLILNLTGREREREMSWAEEDWTVGLSGRVLQKVKELQVHEERLTRENKQKQLQLDNIQTGLEKQNLKYEDVRRELQCLQRELRGVEEEAKAAVTTSERLTQEIQTKQALVFTLEGQVDAARNLNNKLALEIKRLEAELQKSSRSADATLFSTPCWNATSPWEDNVGGRKEERPGCRDEGLHIRRLQFSEVGSASSPQHQNKNAPHRHASDQSDVFSTPVAVFPWEQDNSRPAARRASPSVPQTPGTDVTSQGLSEQREILNRGTESCDRSGGGAEAEDRGAEVHPD
ncbi:Centromere protein F [Liparis tanakae]|uniref:Centromere protein F n=1 Tax=Liparis tanakae TaxID=230148 RepID=A0A4Z2FX53_9TELE|nr:Centromere protein F [Liparis tanakae]